MSMTVDLSFYSVLSLLTSNSSNDDGKSWKTDDDSGPVVVMLTSTLEGIWCKACELAKNRNKNMRVFSLVLRSKQRNEANSAGNIEFFHTDVMLKPHLLQTSQGPPHGTRSSSPKRKEYII